MGGRVKSIDKYQVEINILNSLSESLARTFFSRTVNYFALKKIRLLILNKTMMQAYIPVIKKDLLTKSVLLERLGKK